jgi:hypothetical protein
MIGRFPNIVRGRLSADERAQIEKLATSMRAPTPGKIARKLNRHPATVKWYMLTHGLIEQKPGRAARVHVRNGRTIHPYSPEHDARLLALRTLLPDAPYRVVAERLTTSFGIERDAHSVQVRLALLAAAPDEDAA